MDIVVPMYYVRSYTSACCDLFYRNRQSRNCLARPSHNSSKYAQGLGQGTQCVQCTTHVYFKDFFGSCIFYRIGVIIVFHWGLVQSFQLGLPLRRSAMEGLENKLSTHYISAKIETAKLCCTRVTFCPSVLDLKNVSVTWTWRRSTTKRHLLRLLWTTVLN